MGMQISCNRFSAYASLVKSQRWGTQCLRAELIRNGTSVLTNSTELACALLAQPLLATETLFAGQIQGSKSLVSGSLLLLCTFGLWGHELSKNQCFEGQMSQLA